MGLLGRDSSGDTSTRSQARWTATSRSAEGMFQTDRKPTTGGDAPPKTSPRDVVAAVAKFAVAAYLFYKLTED